MKFPKIISVKGNMPYAVKEMKKYLSLISMAEFSDTGFPINLYAGEGFAESFFVDVSNSSISIKSGSQRGLLYGVYSFLEKLGVRFFASDEEYLPKIDEINVESYSSSPDFAYRDLYWRGALDGAFSIKCRLNSTRAHTTSDMGNTIRFYNYSHTFDELIPPDEYFDTHPDYFSFFDGKRQKNHSQICMTNPDVLKICTDKVLQWMRDNPNHQIFSVAQNDWYGGCECDNCKSVDQKEGSQAATLILFVNAIADAIKEEFPNNKIHTFAYLHTRKAPKTIMPRDNVIIRLCPIECCKSHPLGGCDYVIDRINVENNCADAFRKTDYSFITDLKEWSKITKHLHIWDYTTNYSNYLQPFPNLSVQKHNLKLYKKYGVEGMLMQGNYSPGETSAFANLRIYLLSKLLWNTEEDEHLLIDEYIEHYYGIPAKEHILSCLKTLENTAQKHHMGIFDMPNSPYLDEDTLNKADEYLKLALDSTSDEKHLIRIKRERLSIIYAKLVRLPQDAPNRDNLVDDFAKQIEEFGIKEIFERRELKASIECIKNSQYTLDRHNVPYEFYRL